MLEKEPLKNGIWSFYGNETLCLDIKTNTGTGSSLKKNQKIIV